MFKKQGDTLPEVTTADEAELLGIPRQSLLRTAGDNILRGVKDALGFTDGATADTRREAGGTGVSFLLDYLSAELGLGALQTLRTLYPRLYDYQAAAVIHQLRIPRCALFLPPGYGKTLSVLTALELLRIDGRLEDGVLVVAPLRVARETWAEEIALYGFTGFKPVFLHGKNKTVENALNHNFRLINPEGLEWYLRALKPEKSKQVLILDESSLYRNWSKRTRLAASLSRKSARVVLMSGTPKPKGWVDIYRQFKVLDQGHTFGTNLKTFRGIFMHSWTTSAGITMYEDNNQPHVVARAQRAMMLRTFSSAQDIGLPPLEEEELVLPLHPDAKAEIRRELSGANITKDKLEQTVGRLQQIASGQLYVNDEEGNRKGSRWIHDSKYKALDRLLEEYPDHRFLIFFQYKTTEKVLIDKYGAANVEQLKDWKNGKYRLAAVHPASAGHGLNLQGGRAHVIFFDTTYNAEHYEQSIRRVHRKGHLETVKAFYMTMDDTVDRRAWQVVKGRIKRQAALVAAIAEASNV